METCIDWFIKDEVLRRHPLYSNQYSYREGVSVEMALHAFVSRIETQLERGNHAVTVMDVEGADQADNLHLRKV